jgi:hypothetical protein
MLKEYTFLNPEYTLFVNKSILPSNGCEYYMMYIYNKNTKTYITSDNIKDACIAGNDELIVMIYFFLTSILTCSKYVLFRPVVSDGSDTYGHNCEPDAPFYIYIVTIGGNSLKTVDEITNAYATVLADFDVNKDELCNNIFLEVSKKKKKDTDSSFNNTLIIPNINKDHMLSVNDYNIQNFQDITSLLNNEPYDIFKKYIHCIYKFVTNGPNKKNYIIHFSGLMLNVLHCKVKSVTELNTRLERDFGLITADEKSMYFTNCNEIETNIVDTQNNKLLIELIDALNYEEVINILDINEINLCNTYNGGSVLYSEVINHILTKYKSLALTKITVNKLLDKIRTMSDVVDGKIFIRLAIARPADIHFNFNDEIHNCIAVSLIKCITNINAAILIALINFILTLETISLSVFDELLGLYAVNVHMDNINILSLPETHKNFNEVMELYIMRAGFGQNNINLLFKSYPNKQDIIKFHINFLIEYSIDMEYSLFKKNMTVLLDFKPDNNYKIVKIIPSLCRLSVQAKLVLQAEDANVFKSEYYQIVTPERCNILYDSVV